MENSKVHLFLEGKVTFAKEEGGHKIYNIVYQEERQEAEQDFRLFSIGPRPPTDSAPSTRCVLLLGETGAGKSTFINAVLNYLFGVKFDDPFRLQIEEKVEDGRLETDSRTDDINVYTVHYQEGMKHRHNFVFIDTPGLADTREEKGTHASWENGEEKIMKKLESLLGSDFGVDDLHCLGIVAKGNTNRIVKSQKKSLLDINSLLGKYTPDITHIFATFALETVSVDAVVKDSGTSFKEMFKFDNGCLFCPKESDDAYDPSKRWKIMTEQYDTLFDALIKAPSVSIAIIRNKKLYGTCKSNLRKQKELLVESLTTIHKNGKIYKEYESMEQENKDWKSTELILRYDRKKLEGSHAHNCTKCNETCNTCSSMWCTLTSMSPTNAAVTVGTQTALRGGIAFTVGSGEAAALASLTTSTLAGLAAGSAVYIGAKAVNKIRGNPLCEKDDCQHPISEHVVKQKKKTKRYEKKENIDIQMMKKYEAAVSCKSKAYQNYIEGKEKAELIRNKLSEYTVKLLFHGKRIHELNEESFNYMEDINCYLDELQAKDHHNCSSLEEVAEKNVVRVLKEAVKQLDSCTTEQDSDDHELVKKMLSDISERVEAGQWAAVSE